MLQCQSYILTDQVSTFQSVARKAAVKVAEIAKTVLSISADEQKESSYGDS